MWTHPSSILRPVIVLVILFTLLIGLAFGSFLNVCISRLPRHESIVRPPSHCPACGKPISPCDNLPILSWILLRGRCRHCHWHIPFRYPLVELATAALFLLSYLAFGITLQGIGTAVLCFLLLGLAVMDAETLLLPNTFTLPGLAVGILYSGRGAGWRGVVLAITYAAAAAVLILLIRGTYWLFRRQEGLGLGDAKLLAMIAAWLGVGLTGLVFVFGIFATALFGLALVLIRGRNQISQARLPFGSFLCAAGIFAAFYGDSILKWYLRFYR
jgi:leader peptidase (prepilin peptidase) / N-methyltransferase